MQNVPPLTDTYPGSFFNPDFTILDSNRIEDEDQRATGLSLITTVAPEAFSTPDAVWQWPFLGTLRDQILVSAKVENGTMFAIMPESIAKRIDDSMAAKALIARGIKPLLIDRVWQGRVELVVSRRPGMSDTAWAQVVDAAREDIDQASRRGASEAVELVGDDADAPHFSLLFKDPIVFSFSVVEVEKRGSAPGTSRVTARRILASELDDRRRFSMAETPPIAPRPWMLATISSGWYQRMAPLNQPWNAQSASVVAEALAKYLPLAVHSFEATRDQPLTREATLAFVRTFGEEAKRRRVKLLVVYYIGHMVTHDDQTLTVLMGDAEPSRDSVQEKGDVSTAGGNLDALARSISAIQRKLALPPGELELNDLYNTLHATGLPFILAVDGCLEVPSFAAFRDRLGLVIGPKQLVQLYIGNGSATQALHDFATRLYHFPDGQPFLKARNPVLLGAAPGTFAKQHDHPRWRWGPPVGPLASYIATTAQRSKAWPDRPSLVRLLHWSAENKMVGQINLRGTMSWSDWGPLLSASETPAH